MKYNVGMYGGSFNPLHLGHVDCIIQAANQCNELYIVLSVGDRRAEIEYKIRYRWLYQLTKHIGNVKLIILHDEAETKEAYSRANWQQDAQKVKAQIKQKIDVVFCGSDYGEDSFWNVCYPESELVIFPRNEISSTQIRQHPYQYWHHIPRIVRPYYTKKVLLIGGESTGKSTLTVNLANRFNTNYIDEAGREISQRSGTDALMLPADFTEILLQHKLNELKALKQSNQVLFIDTDALVTQFYIHFLKDSENEKNSALAQALSAINSYDLILFLEPDVAFVQDGDRSEVIRQDRATYSEQIKALLRAHHPAFVSLSGTYQQRYEKAVAKVQQLLA